MDVLFIVIFMGFFVCVSDVSVVLFSFVDRLVVGLSVSLLFGCVMILLVVLIRKLKLVGVG